MNARHAPRWTTISGNIHRRNPLANAHLLQHQTRAIANDTAPFATPFRKEIWHMPCKTKGEPNQQKV
jgi:hypothetical protein